MKNGDVVLFTERGQSHVATVLGVRELEQHSGKDGEPLLHLGFFAPVVRTGPDGKEVEVPVIGTNRQGELVQFRLDVAHDSHEFPVGEDGKQPPAYPGGRWTILSMSSSEPAPIESGLTVQ